MAVVVVASCEALSRTNVHYRTELRLEREGEDPVWVIETIVSDPAKAPHFRPVIYPSREVAEQEYAKYVSMLDTITRQRIDAEATGQIRLFPK